jgi:hypothetical protein
MVSEYVRLRPIRTCFGLVLIFELFKWCSSMHTTNSDHCLFTLWCWLWVRICMFGRIGHAVCVPLECSGCRGALAAEGSSTVFRYRPSRIICMFTQCSLNVYSMSLSSTVLRYRLSRIICPGCKKLTYIMHFRATMTCHPPSTASQNLFSPLMHPLH